MTVLWWELHLGEACWERAVQLSARKLIGSNPRVTFQNKREGLGDASYPRGCENARTAIENATHFELRPLRQQVRERDKRLTDGADSDRRKETAENQPAVARVTFSAKHLEVTPNESSSPARASDLWRTQRQCRERCRCFSKRDLNLRIGCSFWVDVFKDTKY